MALPTFKAISAVIGYWLEMPRIPSVPKSFPIIASRLLTFSTLWYLFLQQGKTKVRDCFYLHFVVEIFY
jgi:hypothetical protein